jgi:hypothetical protein
MRYPDCVLEPNPSYAKGPQVNTMSRRHNTDEIIPQSGVYFVVHERHRLIRTVRLFSGDRFPRCSQCSDAVK